jgi:hypothetical protein
MGLIILFMLGIANFAMHKAVLESGHPMLRQMPWFDILGGRFSLFVEFFMLLGAMLMVESGSMGWAWAYIAYSAVNAAAAWLILTHRL